VANIAVLIQNVAQQPHAPDARFATHSRKRVMRLVGR
jgi:hypothetical protein